MPKGRSFIANKILIVEDDPSFLRAISHILEKEGYQILSASNGLLGLKKAKDESPDMLILDVMLPGLDGFEVCHRLRNDAKTARLPILMLSAKGQEADRTAGLRVGANEFLNKPVELSTLISTVKSLLAGERLNTGDK
ncbi:MAG: response regulator [Dehalococcoidia bacterium]|nr:response regulator [Dehalococcoidia bacterium]